MPMRVGDGVNRFAIVAGGALLGMLIGGVGSALRTVSSAVAPEVSLVLILVDSLGDCAPDADCGKGFLRYVALPTLIVILPVGFGVRAAINRFRGTDS